MYRNHILLQINMINWHIYKVLFKARDYDWASVVVWRSVDQGMLEEATVSVCKNFVVNNGRTGNLASLISVFLIRANELKVSAQCHEWVGKEY